MVTAKDFASSNADFNERLRISVNETIHGLLGDSVLRALHQHLKEHYDVVPDELPYRLDTLFDVLEKTLGVKNSITIGRAIAKNFYSRIGLQFNSLHNYSLQDYLQQARKELDITD